MYMQKAEMIIAEVKKAVIGKDECVRKVMMTMLAGGHVLIEDIPGVGKTTMALAFSKACGLKQNRVQFTPDVLPSDITGFSIYKKELGVFSYQPGVAMCNLLLADEINRTSPKTQSALLEVMEEGNVTVDGETREVPRPFLVMATQNPVGSAGTQMLPESQLDRFMVCISMGYPDLADEIEIIKGKDLRYSAADIEPIIADQEMRIMQKEADNIFVHDAIYSYMVKLVAATREHSLLELGASPRGTIALSRIAKASAYLSGRTYVTPEDVSAVAKDVLLHRIKLSARARINHATKDGVMDSILDNVPKPSPKRK